MVVYYTDRTQQRDTPFLVVITIHNNNTPTTQEPALVAKEVAREGAREVTHLTQP